MDQSGKSELSTAVSVVFRLDCVKAGLSSISNPSILHLFTPFLRQKVTILRNSFIFCTTKDKCYTYFWNETIPFIGNKTSS